MEAEAKGWTLKKLKGVPVEMLLSCVACIVGDVEY